MTSAPREVPDAIGQFEIERIVAIELFGIDISFTNSASAMLATILVIAGFFWIALRRPDMVPGRLQAAAEYVFEFVRDTVSKNGGPSALAHVPMIFTIYVFILFGCLIGLTPLKFTFTSHIIVTLALALFVFGYTTILGIRLNGRKFLRTFLPAGTPAFIAPLIIVIELISYLFRPVTLGVRLFANVLAGHMIIKLFAGFSAMLTESLGSAGLALALLPMLMNIVFFGFEAIIFLLQSYIFVLLTCIYIRSSIETH
jgi:F-type H+-transporting ATPase subunit a